MDSIAPALLKQQAQNFLKQIGLYQRLKASCIYDFYWSWVDPHWIMDRAREVQFYRAVLSGFQKRDIIFDIGANDGFKTDVFLRLGAKIVAVEPDETNLEILKEKFLRNRIFPRWVTVEGKAVSDRVGKMPMFVQAPGSALNTLSPKWANSLRNDETRFSQHLDFALEKMVETTTLEDLIARHGLPYYVKIDIEGYELNALRGLKQRVPYLSFEVNLPEFKEEAFECIHVLNRLAPDGEFNYSSDCRVGLEFPLWMPHENFVNAFGECKKSAVEIFWRTPKCSDNR